MFTSHNKRVLNKIHNIGIWYNRDLLILLFLLSLLIGNLLIQKKIKSCMRIFNSIFKEVYSQLLIESNVDMLRVWLFITYRSIKSNVSQLMYLLSILVGMFNVGFILGRMTLLEATMRRKKIVNGKFLSTN